MESGFIALRRRAGIGIAAALLTVALGCGEDKDNHASPQGDPSATVKYRVYGFPVEEFGSLSVSLILSEGTLVGTEEDGTNFNMLGHGSFAVYVPAESGTLRIDAIGLGETFVESSEEHAHYSWNINPTGTTWSAGDSYVEGPPDGRTIESVPGVQGYYGFSTLGQQMLSLRLAAP
jgi:hypothetical protein